MFGLQRTLIMWSRGNYKGRTLQAEKQKRRSEIAVMVICHIVLLTLVLFVPVDTLGT